MVDRLSNLIGIFQKPELDFSRTVQNTMTSLEMPTIPNAALCTESGKSKGQFYTPSEVSRVIAR
jgi:type I restriction enzyme M protein